MSTDCIPTLFEFEAVENRQVKAAFDGGVMTSDGGALLLRQVDQRLGLSKRLARCFTDHRKTNQIEHTVQAMVAQRIHGIALGYEDLNDHDTLRHDPMIAVLADKLASNRSDSAPGAGRNTLNRLELAANGQVNRYRKVVADFPAIEALPVELFLKTRKKPRQNQWLVLDLDATDFPLHGRQEGRFFHGYYDHYCYLPLYIFCGDFPLAAKLRPSNIDGSAGALEEVQRIVAQIRQHWRGVRILLRADSGFAREEIMAWCEQNDVDFLFGLAKNTRLEKRIQPQMEAVEQLAIQRGAPARAFRQFWYSTRKSWSQERRVVAKAEWTQLGANPRFVVTSIPWKTYDSRSLYEDLYCARGEMENRIKEQQLCLFAHRVSTHTMRTNQLRLWFATFAYVLINHLREVGLRFTSMARARADTIRIRLLKIGARVRVSVRRVFFSMASSHPWQREFTMAYERLRTASTIPD